YAEFCWAAVFWRAACELCNDADAGRRGSVQEMVQPNPPAMPPKIDPITRSVVQHRLGSIVKEMGEAMLRTSYSQILNSSRDFSLAIHHTPGWLIAHCERRLFSRHHRHARTADCAGRAHSGPCRRAALGDAGGGGAFQGHRSGR